MSDPKLDQHLCFKLYVASRLIMRGYGERLAPFGLTYPKYLCLLALEETGPATVGTLSARLALDSGTLSPLLKSLADAGQLKRQRAVDDDRTVINQLTAAGRAALKKAKAVAQDLYVETAMDCGDYQALCDRMDDYIARCQRILSGSTLTHTKPLTGKSKGLSV